MGNAGDKAWALSTALDLAKLFAGSGGDHVNAVEIERVLKGAYKTLLEMKTDVGKG